MKLLSLVVIVILSLPIISSGRLFQVMGSNTYCLFDEVEYECIDDEEGIINWDISSGNSGQLFTTTFSLRIGTEYHDRYGSSLFTAKLIFGNSTYLSSVLRITGVRALGDSVLRCNREMVILSDSTLSTVDLHRLALPKSITIRNASSNQIYVTWNRVATEYNLTVVSSSMDFLFNGTINESYIRLNSTRSTYVFTFVVCQTSAVFTFGGCPFINDISTFTVIQYNVGSNGTYQAVIRYSNGNTTFVIGCYESGHWNNSSDICTLPEIITKESVSIKTTNTTVITTTGQEEVITCSDILGISTTVFAGSLVGSNSLLFLIGVAVGTFIGIRMGLYIASRKISRNYDVQSSTVDGPLYDELELNTTAKSINLSENIAYGHTTLNA